MCRFSLTFSLVAGSAASVLLTSCKVLAHAIPGSLGREDFLLDDFFQGKVGCLDEGIPDRFPESSS